MIDRSTPRTLDDAPEADRVEQSTPAYQTDDADTDDRAVAETAVAREARTAVDRDVWSASEADLIEQAIPVPLDDEDRDDTE
ncbi:hypothetical protein [Nocardia bhagyanarayanae]|uniref:DUF5709 domain-containing protein n=1 Tax=Nocardia bhagyanarayanae TaxID=1215925 RepID=A0A543F8Y1_9NOCA|nr:hypothetical protein [Nocardia bhagyanarayanae]TQM30289.1 hypothetical protein FB390_1908 [Nocardia bhagyanarayanae]